MRYLRPEQVVARTLFMAERRLDRLRPGALERRLQRKARTVAASSLQLSPTWTWPAGELDPAARAKPDAVPELSGGRFAFLNEPRTLGWPPDWSAPGASRLWRYQLHYFGWLLDLGVAVRHGETNAYRLLREAVLDWSRHHPASADDAWHPFVASARLTNWLIARDLVQPELERDPTLASHWARDMVRHALFLESHLETDVGGNHLLKNLVALLVAGCVLEGHAAKRWRTTASSHLERELRRQVLADGGHYERSPMYHLLVLEDLLVAHQAARARRLEITAVLDDTIARMRDFAAVVLHPDGDVALFNDAVLGEAPTPAALGVSAVVQVPDRPASGYFRLSLPEGVLLADCGAPGPDDLPAHVHADALSFELSIGHQRVFVDGGVRDYQPGPLRQRLRGTAAHNTLEVDGQDQSEVWGTFRVGHRARVRLRQWQERSDGTTLVGDHDGYARLGVRHERRFDAVPGTGWRIQDLLVGHGHHTVVSRLRLHPALRWRKEVDGWHVITQVGEALLHVRPFGPGEARVEAGWYAERFGALSPCEVLALRYVGELPVLVGYWIRVPGAPSATPT